MIDKKKVIEGLRCLSDAYCTEKDCDNCKYDFASCVLDVSYDALQLLKDQESLEDDKKELKWFARIRSDYSPDTFLLISRSEDGDVSIKKIIGDDEMRIATSGGHLHGDALVRVIDAFQTLINVINRFQYAENEGYTDLSGLMPAT